MAIKTFISQGDKWAQVTGAVNSSSAKNWDPSCGMSTWDQTKIDWKDYTTTTPIDITWTGTDSFWGSGGGGTAVPSNPYDIYGGPLGGQTIGCPGNNQFINTDINWFNNFAIGQFTKPAGVRPDVLMGFFSQYIHALMFITDGQTHVMPFMERLGMIWIQHELNKWTAYDRKEFYAFIDNPDATTFVGTSLNKREVQRTMSESKDE
jgi:hypothetical protein